MNRLFLLLVMGLWVALAGAQTRVVLQGPLRTLEDGGKVYRVTLKEAPSGVPMTLGITAEPREAAAVRPLLGRSQATWFTDAARGQVLEAAVYVRPDTLGAVKVVGFANPTGFFWNAASDFSWLPVAALPAPTLSSPISGRIVSASPVFRARIDTPTTVTATYEIEVTNGSTINRTYTVLGTTNAYGLYYTPWTAGFPLGVYQWRARGIDGAGVPGPWSASRSFTASGGIDAAGGISQTAFNNLRAAGWMNHFAASWGGYNVWPAARQNMINATNAGMKVAMYVFLNFDNGSTISGAPANQTGQWQVDRALANVGYTGPGSLPFDLKYIMIDIENRFWGTMSQADRVQRIAEAVQRVRNLGFRPMIYTRNEGFNPWWNDATGSSRDFKELYLWGSKPETETAVFQDDLLLDVGNPWVRFGGWTSRGGKQHLLDKTVFGARIDMNVWDPAVWDQPALSPGAVNFAAPTHNIVRLADGSYRLTMTLRNTGNVEAYAVRVDQPRLAFTTLPGRFSMGMIPPGQSSSLVFTFPASTGVPGTRTVGQFRVLTGDGPRFLAASVTLP